MKRLAAFLLLLLFIFPLSADSTLDFVHVGIDITVSESKTYTVVENLTIDYREPHHGFIRDIPLDGASLEIIDVSGDYSVQTSGGITSIVIGNADETVQGVKDYTLSYRIDPGFDRFPGYDEFCIDLFSAYDQSVNNIQFSVAFPSQIDQDKVWVTYGPYGSTRLLDFQFTDGRIITGTLDELGDGETITIEAEMADGYFIRSDYSLPAFIVSLVISLALIGLYVFLYIRFGRDEEPVVSVRFSPPDNLSPLDIGYLFDSNDDTRDYTAMIYYWADQGLLSIEEKDEDEFILHKKKDIAGDREAYEVNLFNALFKSGSDADLSGLNIFQDIQSSVRPLLKAKYSKGEKALSDAKSQRVHNICFALTFVYCLAMAFSVAVNDRSFGLFAFREVEHCLGCTGVVQHRAVHALVGYQPDERDVMLLGHRMKRGTDRYGDTRAIHLDHGHMLLGGGVRRVGHQLGHLLAAAYHGYAGIMDLADDVLAVITDVELHFILSLFEYSDDTSYFVDSSSISPMTCASVRVGIILRMNAWTPT